MSGATLLLARLSTSECRGTDVVLGVVGLALSFVQCAGFVLVWHAQVREPASWECVVREISLEASRLRLVVRRTWEWRCIGMSSGGRDGLAAAWVVLLEYRDLPYGAVDAFVLAAVSCVSVVSILTTSDAQCRGWSLVVALVLVVQLALLVALRPFTTVFSSVYNAVTLVLTILSALSQLVFVWAYAAEWAAVVGGSGCERHEANSFGLDALLRDDSTRCLRYKHRNERLSTISALIARGAL